jgi:hypothetical protein
MEQLVQLATYLVLGLISLFSIPTPVPANRSDIGSIAEWEAVWTSVLTRHVDERGRIDFSTLKDNHDDLDRVVAFIAALDPATQPVLFPDKQTRLAFDLNAYNALAMYGVLNTGIPESLGGLKKISFFYLRTFTVGGRSISLYDLENKTIRPFGDERVHFALNCMVVGCPRLPRVAFNAGILDHQLDAAANEFMAEERNVRVTAGKREVWLSAIFDFYQVDFLAHAPSLIGYVNRYRAEQIPSDFAVRFFAYDWTVNDRTRLGAK